MGEAQRQPQAARAGGNEPPAGGAGGGEKPPAVISKDEFRALLAAVRGPQAVRDTALLWTAYATAARRSELRGMLWENVNFGTARILFWRPKVSGWHNLPLEIPEALDALKALSRERRAELRTIAPLSGPIFLSLRGGPLTENGIWRLVDKWARAAGLCTTPAVYDGKPQDEGGRAGVGYQKRRARPHVLRASRATHCRQDGVSTLAIMHLLGHKSLVSTETYTRPGSRWLEGELAKSSL